MNKRHNMKDYTIKMKKFLFKKILATKIKLSIKLFIPPYNKNLDIKFF